MKRESAAAGSLGKEEQRELREDIETLEEMFKRRGAHASPLPLSQEAWPSLLPGGESANAMCRCRKDDEKGEIPPAYVCQLTMDVFRDPVMTPSGLSYERSALMEHLSKVAPRSLSARLQKSLGLPFPYL